MWDFIIPAEQPKERSVYGFGSVDCGNMWWNYFTDIWVTQ